MVERQRPLGVTNSSAIDSSMDVSSCASAANQAVVVHAGGGVIATIAAGGPLSLITARPRRRYEDAVHLRELVHDPIHLLDGEATPHHDVDLAAGPASIGAMRWPEGATDENEVDAGGLADSQAPDTRLVMVATV